MIQLVKLRTYINKEGEEKVAHKFFDPPILAESVQDIFSDPQFYTSQIPEKEQWNVYFTACKAKLNSRSILEQDIVPFDIDNINVDRKGEYIEPICSVLGLSSDEVGVVFSGNGLQLIVGLKDAFKTKEFFDKYRAHYKAVCEKIDFKLKEFNLPGNADPAVFSDARLLRMPETFNRKPNKPERKAQVLRDVILSNGFDLEKISGIPKVIRGEAISPSELKRYPTPDVDSVLEGCAFLKHIKKGDYTEPQWYGALSILARLPDGHTLSHEYSKTHPKYKESVTDLKIGQALEASGPRTCTNINSLWGMCGTCPNFQKVKSPISIVSPGFIPEKIGTKIPETFVVKKMLTIYADKIVQQEQDLFLYKNGIWKELRSGQINILKQQIMSFYGATAKSKDAESAFKAFLYQVPEAPVDMFKPNPYCVNFLNGTLHIYKCDDQTWKKEFRAHNPKDYLINQLNFDYSDDYSEQNKDFLEMLDRIFEKDADKVEKILAIKQMYGACLIPAFPHLFMLHGPAGSGKTTLVLPLFEFLKESNICSVEPYQFQNFGMSDMAGKLVNIVTDIDTKKPIEDANIKKIEDRVPVRIDRKFRSAIYAPLPAVHIFCGNDIPPTLDGSSKAHSRRWTFIEFGSYQAKGFYDKSFSSYVFNKSPRGILNFALEGLDELLLSRGHFLNPSSGKAKIEKWMTAGDLVQQFLNDISNFEVKSEDNRSVILDEKGHINRTEFHEVFMKWYNDAGHEKFKNRLPRNSFYDVLRSKKIEFSKSNGNRVIIGFSFRGADL